MSVLSAVKNPKNRPGIIVVIACTLTALGCGTNYAYSVWAPSFAARLKLSSTETNLIGTFGNLGQYSTGIPLGMMIDSRGPRWGLALGILFFLGGYYPIARAHEAGPGSTSVALLCLYSYFTGAGSCSAFTASIKAAALNFPDARGTATAFPLAAFGLSAFFFAAVALLLPHDTYDFLILLASGTIILPLISFPFMRTPPAQLYQTLPQNERLHRTRSANDGQPSYEETGTPSDASPKTPTSNSRPSTPSQVRSFVDSETSSLLSTPPDLCEDPETHKQTEIPEVDVSHHKDIRGFKLLPLAEFWQLFCMLGLMTGIGLMTINNIGNDAYALWHAFDPKTPASYITQRQAMHVSILSLCSFTGRLLSGIGSDLLVSRLGRSRFWCLFVSACVFTCAQLLGTSISDPHYLVLVSGLTGLAYGMLFGVYPSLVAHCFGVHGLSQNWGTMTLAPVISGNIFNILYGRVYDSHSVVKENGDRECDAGRHCYSAAYWVTFFAAVVSVGAVLWSIWHERKVHSRRNGHGRLA